jgi:hypothetical protein
MIKAYLRRATDALNASVIIANCRIVLRDVAKWTANALKMGAFCAVLILI